ncbi:F0F1 ATP synthase subunit delta [Lederbergia citrea]|uniref:ATP synthase subunit delta n=1 Tax=Lederbergia citrea TaxID=2833581 RepID=A0A942Z5H2_9BACI|nr:F0F1 ATP synthase subunit delta [Lederbergia citrea]MBS4223425.1 F0F1 ATP synthase subunit delta [Lederbergia citrea]
MSQNIVAERYALALFQLAKEHNIVQKMEEELRVVRKAVQENPAFITLLTSPNMSLHEKKNLLQSVFSGVSPFVSHTLMLLIDRHRESDIADVAGSFIELANKENGIAEATVYTVRPLTALEADSVSASFAPKVGRRSLNIENIVDTNLLGGMKVRIGNRIFDGSLRGKLDRLERTLTT